MNGDNAINPSIEIDILNPLENLCFFLFETSKVILSFIYINIPYYNSIYNGMFQQDQCAIFQNPYGD